MAFREDLYPDAYFDQLHRVTKFAAPERKWKERDRDILSLARPAPDKTVLDLGSALGNVCFLLAPHVREAIGVDASLRAIALAEERRRKLALTNVRFVHADVAELAGIPDASIDVAGAFDLLEHVDDATVRAMLRSVRRVLKPGGSFVAYTPNRDHYVERLKAANLFLKQFPEHIAVRRPRELTTLLDDEGWRVRTLRFSPAPFPAVRWIERALWRLPLIGPFFRYRILVEADPIPAIH